MNRTGEATYPAARTTTCQEQRRVRKQEKAAKAVACVVKDETGPARE